MRRFLHFARGRKRDCDVFAGLCFSGRRSWTVWGEARRCATAPGPAHRQRKFLRSNNYVLPAKEKSFYGPTSLFTPPSALQRPTPFPKYVFTCYACAFVSRKKVGTRVTRRAFNLTFEAPTSSTWFAP